MEVEWEDSSDDRLVLQIDSIEQQGYANDDGLRNTQINYSYVRHGKRQGNIFWCWAIDELDAFARFTQVAAGQYKIGTIEGAPQ